MLANAATSPGEAAPLIPAFFTGERLYEICTGPNEPQCWMYVAGVLDGTFEAESSAEAPTICRTDITNRDAAERVVEYLRDNEDIRRKAAAVAVKAALIPVLACAPDKTTGTEDPQGTPDVR